MKYFDKINLSNKRSENESFDEYKTRLKKNKMMIKMHMNGDLIWESKSYGTYIRKIHGNI